MINKTHHEDWLNPLISYQSGRFDNDGAILGGCDKKGYTHHWILTKPGNNDREGNGCGMGKCSDRGRGEG